MPTLNAVDGADLRGISTTTLDCLITKNGVSTLFEYISGQNAVSENDITNARNMGMDVFLNYETNPTSPGYFSPTQGTSDATDTLKILSNLHVTPSMGYDGGVVVFFSVDYAPSPSTPSEFTAINEYFNAIVSTFSGTGFKVGVYGDYDVLGSVKNNCPGVVSFWQTASASGSNLQTFATAYQYNTEQTLCTNLSVDFDEVYSSSYAMAANA